MTNPKDVLDISAYKKLREELKQFRARCKKRGVPEEFLDMKYYNVFATRAIGFGSPVSKDYTTKELMNILPLLDEVGRKNVVIDRVASLVGYSMSSRYVSGVARDKIPINETSIAILENNDIRQALNVVVGVDQLHQIHIAVHMQILDEMEQVVFTRLQAVQDPQTMIQALQILMMHIGQHIDNIPEELGKKDWGKIYATMIARSEKIIKALTMRVNDITKQQQELSQLMATKAEQELQAKLQEVAQNAYVKLRDKEMQNEIRAYRARVEMDIKRQKALEEIAIEDMKANAEIERKAREQQGG